MKTSIKDATTKDLNKINEIMRISKAHWGYDEQFMDIFMNKLGINSEYMKNHSIKLLYVDNQVAGFYNFGINSDNVFELDNFFLHPDYIGLGLGKKLWDACCQTAKEQGKSEFILWSDPNVENFYLKMGCEKIGVRESPMMPNRYPPVLRYKI